MIRVRLIFRFIVWCLQGLLSRVVGPKSIVGTYWRFTKDAIQHREPQLFFILVLGPVISVLATVFFGIAFDQPKADINEAVTVAFCSNMLWAVAAGVSVLWDRFMYEYEESFRILKEHDNV